MNRVSILVPMYGVERYIAQCARSLFMQSYPYCEFIFVDDASKDGTLEALKTIVVEFPQLEERVKIIGLSENGGVAAARNRALDAATGDYLLFVDADDWVDEQIVEKLVLRSIETQTDICNAWCEGVTEDNVREKLPANWIGDNRSHIKAVLGQSHLVYNHVRGMLFRRSIFEDNNLRFTPDVDFGEDYSLLPQILYYAQGLSTLNDYLYFYRTENQGSYMNNISERHIRNYVEAQVIVARFFSSQHDATTFNSALLMGRLNIKKWIFRRGVSCREYNGALFGVEEPIIRNPILKLYNIALDGGNSAVIKLFSVVVNFPLLIRVAFSRL